MHTIKIFWNNRKNLIMQCYKKFIKFYLFYKTWMQIYICFNIFISYINFYYNYKLSFLTISIFLLIISNTLSIFYLFITINIQKKKKKCMKDNLFNFYILYFFSLFTSPLVEYKMQKYTYIISSILYVCIVSTKIRWKKKIVACTKCTLHLPRRMSCIFPWYFFSQFRTIPSILYIFSYIFILLGFSWVKESDYKENSLNVTDELRIDHIHESYIYW